MGRASTARATLLERLEAGEKNTNTRLVATLAFARNTEKKALQEVATLTAVFAGIERAKMLSEQLLSLHTRASQLEYGLWYWSLPWWKRALKRMRGAHAPRLEG